MKGATTCIDVYMYVFIHVLINLCLKYAIIYNQTHAHKHVCWFPIYNQRFYEIHLVSFDSLILTCVLSHELLYNNTRSVQKVFWNSHFCYKCAAEYDFNVAYITRFIFIKLI